MKIGDKVKVINFGYSYPGFYSKFAEMGFKKPKVYKTYNDQSKKEIYTIFNISTHDRDSSIKLYGIEDCKGNQFLLDIRGIVLAESGEPASYIVDEVGQYPGNYIAGFDPYKEDGSGSTSLYKITKRKSKYTTEQINFVTQLVNKGEEVTPSVKKMCEQFSIPYTDTMGRLFRKKMQKAKVTKNVKVVEDTDTFKTAQRREMNKTSQKFIITWAQNATPVNLPFLKNIEAYAKEIGAEVSVVAGRYKNPTSKFRELKDEHWAKEVIPYLDANRHNVHPFLAILSDIKVQPTASTPLSGFNGVTGLESCIIGHPRIHLKSLPVLDGYMNKLLVTTGAVTVENYTDSKAGKKGAFNHQLGFVIAEVDGDIFHLRQVSADKNGDFIDLFTEVKQGVISKVGSCAAIVFGDVHIGDDDKIALEASFDLASKLKPGKIILHDIFNGHSVNHHETKHPFKVLQRESKGELSLKEEISNLKKWFRRYSDYEYVVVRSNHDEFLDRWLEGSDWRREANKKEYLKYAAVLAQNKAPKGIIPYILDKNFPEYVITLGINDSYRIKGWELGVHGHLGAGGSRGSIVQFKNLNTKTVTAHTHAPERQDGSLTAGTLTKLRVGYNDGLSGWLHSNVIIHNNGKAQHINIVKGRYTV